MNWEQFLNELEYLLRILVALVLGFIIGMERKHRAKEAGIRTHAIVAAGAALMTVVSKHGFGSSDGARVAAQIVTGIGFLGAGIIMYRRDSLKGVTTAAGIWTTAGVGMASGAGLYVIAVGAAALVVFIQLFFHLRIPFFKPKQFYIYRIRFNCAEGENEKIKAVFGVTNYSRINFYKTEEGMFATAEVSIGRIVNDDEIKDVMESHEFITSIERIYQLDGGE